MERYETLNVEKQERTVWISLNRPAEANGFNVRLAKELQVRVLPSL